MSTDILAVAAALTDDDLLRRVEQLARHEREASVELIAHLAELDALLLEAVERKKLAATSRPHPSRGTAPHSRHIPAEVRRAAWRRDGGQCAFIAQDGRCTERRYLEFHHIDPYANGGKATIENISLRCRRHNVYEAELVFGRASVVREFSAAHAGSNEDPLPFVTCSGTGSRNAIGDAVAP